MAPVPKERLHLKSPLPPSTCVERLLTITRTEYFQVAFTEEKRKPLVGSVTAKSLRLRKQTWHSNSFRTELTATLARDSGGGTVVSGSFGINPWVRGLLFLVYGALMLLCATTIRTAISSNTFSPAILERLGFLAFVGLVELVGRAIAGGESRFIREQLVHALKARQTRA